MIEHKATAERRPRVLHLSADFPDPINPAKTPVIARLIDLVADRFDHQVFSLNRRQPGPGELTLLALGGRGPPVAQSSVQSFAYGTCLEYVAPSKGLLHATMLERLAVWIADRVARQPERPDLVIGHKLTVEGIVAREVARLLGIPFALTIQGNTDAKILGARRDLRGRFARIYHDAACVFSFAPWAREAVEQRLGKRDTLTLNLPCPTTLDQIRPPVPGGNALISVFHLRNHQIKNLSGLARAMQLLGADGSTARLQVIGGGNTAEMAACAALIAKAANIALTGPQAPDALGLAMNKAIALVLPSKRESFGLVFIEALFAGLPIIYPRGAGVDGYFNALPFAMPVDPRNPQAIAEAMRCAITEEAAIKQALAQWQASGALERFSRTAIGEVFGHGLHAAILSAGPGAGAR